MEVVLRTHFDDTCAELTGKNKIFIGARPQYANALWYYYSLILAQQTLLGSEAKSLFFCELIPPISAYLRKNKHDFKAIFVAANASPFADFIDPAFENGLAEKALKMEGTSFLAAFITKDTYIRMVQRITAANEWETARQRWCQEWLVKPNHMRQIVVDTSKPNQKTANQLLVPKKIPIIQTDSFVAVLKHRTLEKLVIVQRQANSEVNLGNGLTLETIACRNSNQAALKTADLIQAGHTLLSFSSSATGKLREGRRPGFDDCVSRLKQTLSYLNHDDDAAGTHGLLVNAPSFLRHQAAALYGAIAAEEFTDDLPVDGYYHMVQDVEKESPLDASFFERL